jgi:hypothetical protein
MRFHKHTLQGLLALLICANIDIHAMEWGDDQSSHNPPRAVAAQEEEKKGGNPAMSIAIQNNLPAVAAQEQEEEKGSGAQSVQISHIDEKNCIGFPETNAAMFSAPGAEHLPHQSFAPVLLEYLKEWISVSSFESLKRNFLISLKTP